MPTASEITVREVLAQFEGDFAPVANAVENGEFALWIGSGISRNAPNLGDLIERAFDYIRQRAVEPTTMDAYRPALIDALALAEIDPSIVEAQYGLPLEDWPERKAIVDRLWNKYSRVLDIRIAGTDTDFVLWDAIDIRNAFSAPAPPAAEHLCLAVLIMEGAVQNIASANWDGFIEAAVDRLSPNGADILQVVVDPDHLRCPAGRARLLKFHGCIVHAEREPEVFRRFLTGSHTQIMEWPESADFAAMRAEVVRLATNQKTMVLGLSIQDSNLQTLFSRAKAVHAWPWPSEPQAPAHIFCEDEIKPGQRDVLRIAYGAAYNLNPEAVHRATLLRSWAEKVLIALVLRLLGDKLSNLMALMLQAAGKSAMAADLARGLNSLRDDISDHALPQGEEDQSRTLFVSNAIALWSRGLSIFRSGALPAHADAYESLSYSTPHLLAGDANVQAMGYGQFALGLSLLQRGCKEGNWSITVPATPDLSSGAITARAMRDGAFERPVFFVRSATEVLSLKSQGAFANDNAVVIHAEDTWRQMVGGGDSPRRVSKGPGRLGRVGESHVSLPYLVANSSTTAELQQAFVAGVML